MLRIADKQQEEHIFKILKDSNTTMLRAGVALNGVVIDDLITFDVMAEIVDYLRSQDKQDDLFEQCWVAYRRKGIKRKSYEYWRKLTAKEKSMVLPHIKAYTSVRPLSYQRDFERYLRDKVFKTIIVADNNNVIYDPTKTDATQHDAYMPTCDSSLSWNEYYNCYLYVGFWDGKHIPDGYTDETRPDGATVTLNNGRGIVVWCSKTREWTTK